MKKIFLYSLLLLLAPFVPGQEGKGFKQLDKNPTAREPESFDFVRIDGRHKSDNATSPGFQTKQNLPPPILGDQGLMVRKVVTDGHSPVFIEKLVSSGKSSLDAHRQFQSFFEDLGSVTGIDEPAKIFSIRKEETDVLGIRHIHAVQHYKGLEIYGSEVSLHTDGHSERFTGRLHHIARPVDVNPQLDVAAAIDHALDALSGHTMIRPLTSAEKQLMDYESPRCELIIFKGDDGNYLLAYEVEIRPNLQDYWKVFLDAHTGHVLHKFNMTTHNGPATAQGLDLNGVQRTIHTWYEDGQYLLINASVPMFNATTLDGLIITYDANNTSTSNLNFNLIVSANNTWDPKAVSTHYNTTRTYHYLLETFNRNSLNDKGSNIISFINVADDDGRSMENAFWNGKATFFGNGGVLLKPLAGALDIVAHELGHGVVSNTANLEYYGQSGAINETYADIFGSMVDRDNWLIGEKVVNLAYFPSGAARNMGDPHNGGTPNDHWWQPKHVSEMYIGTQDQGGVHINSGIGNHAYYLYATAISKEKAEQVFYRALTTYLKKTSQFIDFRIAVIQSAKDLYGSQSAEVTEAAKAFDAVGIYEEQQLEPEQDYPVNPGQHYMMSTDTNNADPNTLYRSSSSGTDFVAYSKTPMKRKISVMDDGSFGVFIADDNTMKVIGLDPYEEEWDLSSETIWDNVAVSKDGMRIAAITTEIDASIYLYDFGSQSWARFALYNPTTNHDGLDAGGVLYADALEFDITGQYLIYDACNVLASNTTDDVYYWDIGMIRVWNNQSATFGDGKISKLYGSLPESVSIGNPVFSKNSPHIIAFDFYNENEMLLAILGANLMTGELGLITQNTIFGNPSFSMQDDRIAYSAETTTEREVVATIGLAADKINGSGNPEILIPDAKWPVYFATGSRTLGLPPQANFTADIKSGDAPLEVRFIDLSLNDPTSWTWNFPGGSPASSNGQNPSVTYQQPGTYQVSLTAINPFGNNTVNKTAFIFVSEPSLSASPENIPVKFYPNPARDYLSIQCPVDFTLKIVDMHGRLVRTIHNENRINLSGLKPGLYMLDLQTPEQRVVEKLVKTPDF